MKVESVTRPPLRIEKQTPASGFSMKREASTVALEPSSARMPVPLRSNREFVTNVSLVSVAIALPEFDPSDRRAT